MKQLAVLLVVVFLTFWYGGVGKEVYNEKNTEDYLTSKQVKELYAEGVIGRPSYSKQYFSERKTEYFYRRSWIPLVYHRDTIYDTGLKYYNRDRQ